MYRCTAIYTREVMTKCLLNCKLTHISQIPHFLPKLAVSTHITSSINITHTIKYFSPVWKSKLRSNAKQVKAVL